jgi:ArsR family transcriptional regulator
MARPRREHQLMPTTDLACDERIVHVDAVRTARAALPHGAALAGMADLFSALGDPTRLRIVAALAPGSLCVCDLAATVGLSESAISHQLRALRSIGLVRAQRDGRRVYYTLDDEHVIALFTQAHDHLGHQLEEASS